MVNKHVEDYLDYFCNLAHSPEYAVLVKGEWGSGKTWFINKYKEKLKTEKNKFLYVSLYGVSSYSEIEDKFFQQLHPVLSSKGMAITSKILKGALKATIKMDLDGDGKSDGSVSTQVPQIDLPSYLKGTDEFILIFDDLERCNFDIESILGYINHFVEHKGLKVILVANEDEILRKYKEESEKTSYRMVKEKLIGKTLCVVPDVDDAINDFVNKVDDLEAREVLEKNKPSIAAVYAISQYENLRNLKQSIWDFERIYKTLPGKAKGMENLVLEIMSFLLAFSFEIRKGSMLPSEIIKLKPLYYANLFSEDKEREASPLLEIVEKYKILTLQEPLPSENFWKTFFDKGVVDNAEMEASLQNSTYYKDEQTPNWLRLYHFFKLEDNEFNEILAEVDSEFCKREYTDIGIIKHVVGLFLWLSDNALYVKTKQGIIEDLKLYLKELADKGILKFDEHSHELAIERDCYGGLGFFGSDLPEFNEICELIESELNTIKINSLPEEGIDLLSIMKNDFPKFSRMVRISNTEDQSLYDKPIFKYIKPEDFVATYLDLAPENRRKVGPVLEKRYEPVFARKKIAIELEWLKEVTRLLEVELPKIKGKPSGFVMNAMIDRYLKKIIEEIEKDLANQTLEAD